MKISLFGPNDLTSFDKTEIRNYINAVINEHSISLLAYRSIEKEVLKFFVENEEFASKLTVYTFPEFHQLPNELKKTIEFLQARGTIHKTFYYNEMIVKRTTYIDAWKYIVDENDAIVSFFNEESHVSQRKKLMIPIDIAKKSNKRPFIHSLPVHDKILLERKPTEKIKLVQ